MEELKEVMAMLKEAMPMLKEFMDWKKAEAEREKITAEVEAESEREFQKWVADHKKQEAAQEESAKELQKHFFGAEKWKQERFSPHNY